MLKRLFIVFVLVMTLFLAPVSAFCDSHVNINTANAEQLATLPGIGPALAEKIIEYRADFPFESPEDIMKVSGIGEAKFNNMKDMIALE